MKKAWNNIQTTLKWVDLIVEVVDARAVASSSYLSFKHPSSKKTVIVLSKADVADPAITARWLAHLKREKKEAIAVDLTDASDAKKLWMTLERTASDIRQKYINKGMKQYVVKMMVLGVPNVGKSTLINLLVGKRKATVENRPGVTRGQQWIAVGDQFLLLDTPGVLPSSFEDPTQGLALALIGSMKLEHLPIESLASDLYGILYHRYPLMLQKLYPAFDCSSPDSFFRSYAHHRGFLKGSELDIEKAQQTFLRDFSDGKIQGTSLEDAPIGPHLPQ